MFFHSLSNPGNMKPSFSMKSLPLVVALGVSVNACIRVHTFLSSDPVLGDSMKIQMWDGSKLVCSGGGNKFMANENSAWEPDCGGGYRVKITDNGAGGEVWNDNHHYHGTLEGKDHYDYRYCAYHAGLDETCIGNVWDTANVLWDGTKSCTPNLNTKCCKDHECDLPKDDLPELTCEEMKKKIGWPPRCPYSPVGILPPVHGP